METPKNEPKQNQENNPQSKDLLDTLTPESPTIPQELKDFREIWKERVELISDEVKEKIIEAWKKIPVEVKYEPDGSKIITLKLWTKTIRILSPRLEKYTDEEYGEKRMFNYEYASAFDFNGKIYRDTVKLWWMRWDDVSKRENQKLKEYVMQKKEEWYHIAKIEEVKSILSELWKIAGFETGNGSKDKLMLEELSLLMYLTGISWDYWLTMWDKESSWNQDSRSLAHFSMWYCDFDSMDSDHFDGNIFMLANE